MTDIRISNLRQHHQPRRRFGSSTPVLQGLSSALLERIRDPEVELVIWQRRLLPGLGHWLDLLPIEELPDARVLVRQSSAVQAVTEMLDLARTPDGDARSTLRDDIVLLTRIFATLTGTDLIDIQLERIDDDACWKFHRDRVPARLLTTYRGPATEWVWPEESAAALAHQKTFAGSVQRLSGFAVGMFKGSCAEPASGIVHRSPPVDGATRLLLCLNLPSAMSPDLWSQ